MFVTWAKDANRTSCCSCMCIYIYIHTYTHDVYTHTCVYTYIYIYILIYLFILDRTCSLGKRSAKEATCQPLETKAGGQQAAPAEDRLAETMPPQPLSLCAAGGVAKVLLKKQTPDKSRKSQQSAASSERSRTQRP